MAVRLCREIPEALTEPLLSLSRYPRVQLLRVGVGLHGVFPAKFCLEFKFTAVQGLGDPAAGKVQLLPCKASPLGPLGWVCSPPPNLQESPSSQLFALLLPLGKEVAGRCGSALK